MNVDDNTARIPIPKWKALNQTPSRELVSSKNFVPDEQIVLSRTSRMQSLYERWRATPSLDNAFELVDCGSFDNENGLLCGPAAQIMNSSTVTETSKLVARNILNPLEKITNRATNIESAHEVRKEIRRNKARLKDQTRNSLLHAEQARLYTMIDEHSAAEKAFIIALGISPNNRHILRSFSRFKAHLEEPKEALKRLLSSDSIQDDPWLQAAEIALSEFSGIPSQTAKTASQNIRAGRIKKGHISEVSACLATLEHSNGNRKRFYKHFQEMLIEPTDNALAQGMWFLRSNASDLGDEFLNYSDRLFSRSVEARTYSYLNQKKWQDATRLFHEWQQEESFSNKLAIQGSYYAVSFANDYDSAIEICRNGLNANSHSIVLLNNLCVAETRSGAMEKAKHTMQDLQRKNRNWNLDPTYLATNGMLDFALGRIETARQHYIEALSIAKSRDDMELQERIKMHWLFEETNATEYLQDTELLIQRLEGSKSFIKLSEEFKEYWTILKSLIYTNLTEETNRSLDDLTAPTPIHKYI